MPASISGCVHRAWVIVCSTCDKYGGSAFIPCSYSIGHTLILVYANEVLIMQIAWFRLRFFSSYLCKFVLKLHLNVQLSAKFEH